MILPPPYEVVYTPPHITGTYVSGFVYVSITGDGIRENQTGIRENGTYTFWFYRGTGPFTTGAQYSTGNTWSLLTTTQIIDRIDNTPPTVVWVAEGVTYTTPVTITFFDNLPGVTATLNGIPFTNWSTISTNGTYQLIVTDKAGNTTGATFIIYLATTPVSLDAWGGISIGSWWLYSDLCKQRSCYSTYYNDICWPCTPPSLDTPALPSLWPAYHYASPDTPIIHSSTSYPAERIDAYQRAYTLGMISANNIKDANLDGILYRKFAAKIASEFAIKALKIIPDTNRICEFSDINNESDELKYYMKLSCQLGIMGLDYYGNPDTVFNPNHFVTRDQFVTILSRMLFRNTYNLKPNEYTFFDRVRNIAIHTLKNITEALKLNIPLKARIDWYSKHLEAIKKLWLMTNYTISIKEFRIYVILILYRLDKLWYEKVQKLIQ